MRRGATAGRLRVAAPAKLNLFLHVLGRRDDGYHRLDSLIAFASVHDTVVAAEADRLMLALDGPFGAALADAGPDNLVLRAARALAEAADRPAHASLTLVKRLPVASGIGGGSADAAAALKALCALWRLDLDAEVLSGLALSLGADVPVCLAGRAARVGGIGEEIAPFDGLPEAGLLLVNPGLPLSTASVFKARAGAFSPPASFAAPVNDARALAEALKRTRNDLEAPARTLLPEIGEVLNALDASDGCLLARMSGSGATCFGLFEDEAAASRAAAMLALRHPNWWLAPARLLASTQNLQPA
ncbi:MAG: 4-(cytidine 5'-diphospho)-2-C-methyl-D-erythritol kinase [Alphaproteobacteria bacterium]